MQDPVARKAQSGNAFFYNLRRDFLLEASAFFVALFAALFACLNDLRASFILALAIRCCFRAALAICSASKALRAKLRALTRMRALALRFIQSIDPRRSAWNLLHEAFGSDSIMPKMFPSVSLQYASQPTPGMAILGSATVPPLASAFFTCSSMEGVSTVQT